MKAGRGILQIWATVQLLSYDFCISSVAFEWLSDGVMLMSYQIKNTVILLQNIAYRLVITQKNYTEHVIPNILHKNSMSVHKPHTKSFRHCELTHNRNRAEASCTVSEKLILATAAEKTERSRCFLSGLKASLRSASALGSVKISFPIKLNQDQMMLLIRRERSEDAEEWKVNQRETLLAVSRLYHLGMPAQMFPVGANEPPAEQTDSLSDEQQVDTNVSPVRQSDSERLQLTFDLCME
ncbi:Hypothetical predicted protein [Scomber scombrus]|uniref:Uncharacterized protein n=1 Tax=Scomber scombrus TaxID=13677 RepID=A0AAV1PLJ0_SCOSC